MENGLQTILASGSIEVIKTKGNGSDNQLEQTDLFPWDDLSGPLFGARLDTSSGRLDYDPYNGGVNFNANARYPNEPVVIPIQLKHALKYGTGAVLRPHFHWLQQQSAIPNFMIAWKKTNYGDVTTFETDFTNYSIAKYTTNAFTYTSGTLAQITKFPEIDISDMEISSSIDIVIFRDSADTSLLFGASDPVGSGVVVKYNDSHAQFNKPGSKEEFVL